MYAPKDEEVGLAAMLRVFPCSELEFGFRNVLSGQTLRIFVAITVW